MPDAEDTDKIEVHQWHDGDWHSLVSEALSLGHAVQGFTLDSDKDLALECSTEWPQADAYICWRNGDKIIMLVPKGTPLNRLPKNAMRYWALAWENLATGECWSGIENKRLYKRLDPSAGMETYFNTPE